MARMGTRNSSKPSRGGGKKRGQKAPCGECPLYLDHQKHKYRVLSWVSYPAAAALVGISTEHIRTSYNWIEFKLGNLLAGLQVLPHTLTYRPYHEASWFSAEGAAVVLVGVVMVGVILHTMEFAVFRLKL